MTQEESVPIGELQALVEEWNEESKRLTHSLASHQTAALASELQAVIEDYE